MSDLVVIVHQQGDVATPDEFHAVYAPICAAANACQAFCSTELDLFRSVLGQGVDVEREEHIVSGDRRCAYRVTPKIVKSRMARGR